MLDGSRTGGSSRAHAGHRPGSAYPPTAALGSVAGPRPPPGRRPVPQQRPEAAPRFREEPSGHSYGRAALHEELAAVARAPKGRRNHTLYQAAIRLYSLVAGGVLDHAEVQVGLLAAADAARLLAEEPLQTRRTPVSAERTGLAHPLGIPHQQQDAAPCSGASLAGTTDQPP